MKNQQNKAFSLIELSIVLIIIGLLIAGIVGGKSLINSAKLSSARALTNSSPVAGMEDLALWLETTSKKSFNKAQPDDDEILTTWRDINPQSTSKRNATTPTNGPMYKNNRINGLPALSFDGVNDFFNYDGSFLINSDMTVFVVEQRRSAADGMHFIGNSIGADGLRMYYNSSWAYYTTRNAATSIPIGIYSSPFPRIHTISNLTEFYINGTEISITDLLPIVSYANPYIARFSSIYYEGDIGEIIMFTRKLSEFERSQVEEYLAKKWGIKLS